jgi:hypothetical protein
MQIKVSLLHTGDKIPVDYLFRINLLDHFCKYQYQQNNTRNNAIITK